MAHSPSGSSKRATRKLAKHDSSEIGVHMQADFDMVKACTTRGTEALMSKKNH